jgi:hypothetical protein
MTKKQKAKQQRHTIKSLPTVNTPESTAITRLRATSSKILGKVIATLTLLALLGTLWVAGVSYLYPISLEPTTPLDPSTPFSAPFTLLNDFYFPIHNVTYKCHLNQVTFGEGDEIKNANISTDDQPIDWIKPNGKVDIFCPFHENIAIHGAAFMEADISVDVSFQLLILSNTTIFPFRGAIDSRGEWHWLHSINKS